MYVVLPAPSVIASVHVPVLCRELRTVDVVVETTLIRNSFAVTWSLR